jgi:hypothetical protein
MPQDGSWLSMAKIALSVLARQSLHEPRPFLNFFPHQWLCIMIL